MWFAFINFLGDELHHPLDFFQTRCGRGRWVSSPNTTHKVSHEAILTSCSASQRRPYWYLLAQILANMKCRQVALATNNDNGPEVLAATGGLLGIDMVRTWSDANWLWHPRVFCTAPCSEGSGYLDELSNTLPELVVCTNLQEGLHFDVMMGAKWASTYWYFLTGLRPCRKNDAFWICLGLNSAWRTHTHCLWWIWLTVVT